MNRGVNLAEAYIDALGDTTKHKARAGRDGARRWRGWRQGRLRLAEAGCGPLAGMPPPKLHQHLPSFHMLAPCCPAHACCRAGAAEPALPGRAVCSGGQGGCHLPHRLRRQAGRLLGCPLVCGCRRRMQQGRDQVAPLLPHPEGCCPFLGCHILRLVPRHLPAPGAASIVAKATRDQCCSSAAAPLLAITPCPLPPMSTRRSFHRGQGDARPRAARLCAAGGLRRVNAVWQVGLGAGLPTAAASIQAAVPV